MAVTIGVPVSITRTKYLEMLRFIGVDPSGLYYLEFGPNAICATVRASDLNGDPFVDHEDKQIATHKVHIKITD